MRAVPIRDARLTESIALYRRAAKYFSPLQQAAVDDLVKRASEGDAAAVSTPPG
jgi:hypothetical protein